MAKTPITQARDVDAELVLQLNKLGSAADLRSQQAKLTGAAREIRKLTGGGTDLFGKLGCYLSFEQKRLLQDAARLLDSVNQQVEHAKEKRDRDEKQAKKRRGCAGAWPSNWSPRTTRFREIRSKSGWKSCRSR